MRRSWQKSVLSLLLAGSVGFAGVLAGCGGGGGSSSGGDVGATPSTLSGVVADGYLKGAVVFCDIDGDKIQDADEPTGVTGAGGVYNIEDSLGRDLSLYSVVAVITSQTIDEDDNLPVPKGYILTAPAGKHEFVSPLTTLVHREVEANPVLTPDQAAEKVKGRMGVSETKDIFKDYVKEKATDPEYAKMHRVAKVVAGAMGHLKEDLEAAVSGTNVTPEQLAEALVPLLVDRIIAQLDQIALAADDEGVDVGQAATDAFTNGKVAQEEIEREVDKALNIPAGSSWDSIVNDGGVYWLEFHSWDNMGTMYYDIEKGYVQPKSDGTINEAMDVWNFASGGWGPDTYGDDVEYYLTPSGWVTASDNASEYTFAPSADGTSTLSHAIFGEVEKIAVSTIDLAGKKMAFYLEEPEMAQYLVDSAATFPAGAKGYALTFTTLVDTYEVDTWYDDKNPGQDQNFIRTYENCDQNGCTEVPMTSMSGVLGTFAATPGNYNMIWLDGLQIQFGENNSIDIYRGGDYQSSPTLMAKKGTLRVEQVMNQTLYFIDIPAEYYVYTEWMGKDGAVPFLVEMNGQVKQGEFRAAGTVDYEDEFNFNPAAFEALLSNLDFSGIVQGQ